MSIGRLIIATVGTFIAVHCPAAENAGNELPSHIGKDLPEYITGDECLFCHRRDIGQGWQVNAHQLTLRPAAAVPELTALIKKESILEPYASQVQFILGYKTELRLLRKSQGYGKLDLLTAHLAPVNPDEPKLQWTPAPPFQWDTQSFAQQCAGCHTTAVDSRTQAYSATGIDCYACHGDVDLHHTSDTSLVHLSKKQPHSARRIAETCGQCHIRTGRSKTSGLPYPNNYVIGDSLFADFEVDLSDTALQQSPPRERHILDNIKNALADDQSETCLSCHNVHRASGRKHRRQAKKQDCFTCHREADMALTYSRKEKHHTLCGY